MSSPIVLRPRHRLRMNLENEEGRILGEGGHCPGVRAPNRPLMPHIFVKYLTEADRDDAPY